MVFREEGKAEQDSLPGLMQSNEVSQYFANHCHPLVDQEINLMGGDSSFLLFFFLMTEFKTSVYHTQ